MLLAPPLKLTVIVLSSFPSLPSSPSSPLRTPLSSLRLRLRKPTQPIFLRAVPQSVARRHGNQVRKPFDHFARAVADAERLCRCICRRGGEGDGEGAGEESEEEEEVGGGEHGCGYEGATVVIVDLVLDLRWYLAQEVPRLVEITIFRYFEEEGDCVQLQQIAPRIYTPSTPPQNRTCG